MTEPNKYRNNSKTTIKCVSLYPLQAKAVEEFAWSQRRTFSNAMQHIIDRWLEQNPEYVPEDDAA